MELKSIPPLLISPTDTSHSCLFNSRVGRNDILFDQLQGTRTESDFLIKVVGKSGSF